MNPRPPIIISAIMIRFRYQLSPINVREENGSSPPIRSNPALQNAEIEWNMEK